LFIFKNGRVYILPPFSKKDTVLVPQANINPNFINMKTFPFFAGNDNLSIESYVT